MTKKFHGIKILFSETKGKGKRLKITYIEWNWWIYIGDVLIKGEHELDWVGFCWMNWDKINLI